MAFCSHPAGAVCAALSSGVEARLWEVLSWKIERDILSVLRKQSAEGAMPPGVRVGVENSTTANLDRRRMHRGSILGQP